MDFDRLKPKDASEIPLLAHVPDALHRNARLIRAQIEGAAGIFQIYWPGHCFGLIAVDVLGRFRTKGVPVIIVPPLTREQCQLIVYRHERHARAMNQALARYQEAGEASAPPELYPGYINALKSAYQLAEQEAAAAQFLALQALHQLGLTKGAKLL